MQSTINLHIAADDPIGVESSVDGRHVWIRIGSPGNGAVLHFPDYVTACNMADVLQGLAHVLNPANQEAADHLLRVGDDMVDSEQ